MTALLIPSVFLWIFSILNQFGIKNKYGVSQLIFSLVGLAVFFIAKRVGRKFVVSNVQTIFWVFFGILLTTFIVGLEVKGSRRWIDLGVASFQASEFLKIFFIMYLAKLLSQQHAHDMSPAFFIMLLGILLIPAFVVLKQPDLGNAMVFVGIFLIMIFCSDMPKKYLLWVLIITLLLLPFSWFFLHDYQRMRVLSFIQPHRDTQGDAYNMIQAMITIGSGKVWGKGLGLGTQSKLFFLPENNTDFAFSSLVEQFGFMGGFLVILLEGSLIVQLFQRANRFLQGDDQDTKFKYYYALGLGALLSVQTVVNVGMNLGLLPIAGIALPFVSYGGSLFVALTLGFALLKS